MPEEQNKEKTSEDNTPKPFENLDLNRWKCFGISHPKKSSWVNICIESRNLGWKQIDSGILEQNLKKNVDESYISLASFELTNLDDDMQYVCFFDNQKFMWALQIKDSPKAEIELEDKANFFKSDMFKKIAGRTAVIIEKASNEYEQVIDYHLKNGELLSVDEVKLGAILHMINQKFTLDNIRAGKWMK